MKAEKSLTDPPDVQSLRILFNRLVLVKILRWGSTYTEELPDAEKVVTKLEDADVISSVYRINGPSGAERHAVVLDIDHPTWLVRSSTPGHYHLYIEVPGGISWDLYEKMLFAMAEARVIEPGYHAVAKKRKRTDVRLPWIKKAL